MEGQRDESGRYLPKVRQAVIEEVRRSGVWAAVERHGVAYGTVTYWWAQESVDINQFTHFELRTPDGGHHTWGGEAMQLWLQLWRVG